MRKINSFTGIDRFLSNFWPCGIWFEGRAFYSVEAAYQSAKSNDLKYKSDLGFTIDPALAKRKGRKAKLREDWEQVKIPVMLDLLRQKFNEPRMRASLLSTKSAELIEGNWWGDTFWGVCNGVGENWLGKLLMQVREEIRNESERR